MVACIPSYATREIVAIRCRRGFRGRLVLQVQRRIASKRWPSAGGQEKDCGVSQWRDANGKDLTEVAEVMALLRSIASNAGTQREA